MIDRDFYETDHPLRCIAPGVEIGEYDGLACCRQLIAQPSAEDDLAVAGILNESDAHRLMLRGVGPGQLRGTLPSHLPLHANVIDWIETTNSPSPTPQSWQERSAHPPKGTSPYLPMLRSASRAASSTRSITSAGTEAPRRHGPRQRARRVHLSASATCIMMNQPSLRPALARTSAS